MSDSPVKKLNFDTTGKENAPSTVPVDAPTKVVAEKPAEALKVAPGIKEMEANEPLLQENPHRFVLFPIKYHEVSEKHVGHASRVKWNFPIGS
jgi:ribonucleoside-diphosphate reductase subunit M2